MCGARVWGRGQAAGAYLGCAPGLATARGALPGRGEEQIRASAQVIGSSTTFAETWPHARPIPFAVVDKIVLTRPKQVSELAIYEHTADPASGAASTYLGHLSAARVRAALEPILGDRLHSELTD